MKEIRTSGPLMFSNPNCPTRVGEIINTISEIYDIPNPSEGMQVYVRDEKKTYTITGLKEATIGGEKVPNAKVDTFEAVKSQVEEIDNDFAEMQEALSDGSFVVAVANLANAVKAGAVTFEMLDGKLRLSVSVVDNLETANTLMPLSANQGKILKELIDIINGTGEGSTDKKITDAIAALVNRAPENLDTLRELADWIEAHGAKVAEMLADINANAKNLAETKKDIANQLFAASTADKVCITGRNEQSMRINFSADIPAATTEKAGVMSAEDKKSLLAEYDITPCEYTSGYYSEHNNKVESTVGGTSFAKQRIDVTDYSSLVVNSALSGIAGIFITDIEDSILQTVELKDGLALVDLTVLKNVKWLYFTVYKVSMPIEQAYVKGYKKTKDRIDRLEDIVLPQNLKLLQDNNRKDFTWCALGDSMTEINDTSIVGKYITAGYLTRVCREIPNLKYINLGKSGSTIYNTVGLSIPEADVYTIFFGQNDWNTHMALGTVSNFIEAKYDNTVLGSLGALIAKIKKTSSSQIIVMTPIESGYFCGRGKSIIGVPSDTPNENGWTIADMADAIRKCLIDKDIICVDTHSLSYISKDNAVKAGYVMVDGVRTKVSYPDFLNYFDSIPSDLDTELYDDSCAYTTYDGVHPSDLGCQILANCIVEPIRNAIYSKMLNKDNMLINIKDDIVSIKEKMTKEVPFTNNGSFFSLSNAVLGETLSESIVSSSTYSYANIECSEGEEYILSTNGNTSSAKNYVVLDSNNMVLALGNTTALNNEPIIIPMGGKTLIVNSKTDGAEIKTYIKIPIVNYDRNRFEVNGEIVPLPELLRSLSEEQSVTIGKFISLNNISVGESLNIEEISQNGYAYFKEECLSGDVFTVTTSGNNDYAAKSYAIIDSNNIILALGNSTSLLNEVIIIPDGGAQLIVNSLSATIKVEKVINKAVSIDYVKEIDNRFFKNIPFTKNNSYYSLSSATIGSVLTESIVNANEYSYANIECSAGEEYILSTNGNTAGAKNYVVLDSNNIVLVLGNTTALVDETVIIPGGGKTLIVNSKTDGAKIKLYLSIPEVNYDDEKLVVNGETVPLSEEKSSLLPYKSAEDTMLSLYGVSIGSQVPIIESTATNYSYIFLPVIKGDKFKINVSSGGTSSARICCVTDKNLLCTFLTTTSSFDGNVDIVEDGYIIINAKNIDSCVVDKIGEIKDCKTNIPYTKKDYYIPLTDVAVGSQYAVAQSGFATDYCYTVRKVYAGQQFFITTTGNTKYAKSYALFDNEMRCLAFATGTQTQTDRHITIWQDGYLVVNSKIDGFSLINIDTISQKLNTEAFSNVKTEVLDARRYTINDYNNEVAFDAAYIGDLTVPALYLDYNRNIPTTGAAISRDISGKKLPTQHSHEEAQAFYVPFLYLDQQKIGTIVLFDEATGNPFIFDKNGNKKFLSYE